MNPNCLFNPWCIHSVTAKIVKYDFLFMMLIIYPFHSLTYILGNIIPTHKYGYMLNYNERNNFSISICWKPIWHYNHLSNPNDSHYKKKYFKFLFCYKSLLSLFTSIYHMGKLSSSTLLSSIIQYSILDLYFQEDQCNEIQNCATVGRRKIKCRSEAIRYTFNKLRESFMFSSFSK